MSDLILKKEWVICESKLDIENRLKKEKDFILLEIFLSEDCNTWGYYQIELFNGTIYLLPIGYKYIGLKPQLIINNEKLFLGINENIIIYDLMKSKKEYIYKMPTIFHEFILLNKNNIIIRDETGFICLSFNGNEIWTFLVDDIIVDYTFSKSKIITKTMENRVYEFNIPELSGSLD